MLFLTRIDEDITKKWHDRMIRYGSKFILYRRIQLCFAALAGLTMTSMVLVWLIERDFSLAIFGPGSRHVPETVVLGQLDGKGRRAIERIDGLRESTNPQQARDLAEDIEQIQNELLRSVNELDTMGTNRTSELRPVVLSLANHAHRFVTLLARETSLNTTMRAGLRDAGELTRIIAEYGETLAKNASPTENLRIARLQSDINLLYATLLSLRVAESDQQARVARAQFIDIAGRARILVDRIEPDLARSIEELLLASIGPGGFFDQFERMLAIRADLKRSQNELHTKREQLQTMISQLTNETRLLVQTNTLRVRKRLRLRHQLMIALTSITVLLCAATGWWWLGYRLGARLMALVHAAEAVVGGARSTAIDLTGRDELTRLARALDTLCARLAKSNHEPRARRAPTQAEEQT